MAVVNPVQGLHSLKYFNKVGLPNCFGHVQHGWSHFGDKNDYSAYYQRRQSKKGEILVKMRHYWPRQNPGPAEQARRLFFAEGVTAWHNLTPEDKLLYNKTLAPIGQSGFSYFMRLWLTGKIT